MVRASPHPTAVITHIEAGRPSNRWAGATRLSWWRSVMGRRVQVGGTGTVYRACLAPCPSCPERRGGTSGLGRNPETPGSGPTGHPATGGDVHGPLGALAGWNQDFAAQRARPYNSPTGSSRSALAAVKPGCVPYHFVMNPLLLRTFRHSRCSRSRSSLQFTSETRRAQ